MKSVDIELPWGPSANSYWRRNGNRYFISKKGMDYRKLATEKCKILCGFFSADERLSMSVYAYPPDKRKRDIGNLDKCLSDSLQHAGVYSDDYQIDELFIKRMPERLGKVIVHIKVID